MKKNNVKTVEIKVVSEGDTMIEIAAVKGKRTEIGYIQLVSPVDIFRIEFFWVAESERRKGVGRALLETAIDELQKLDQRLLIVYPHPEAYENEKTMKLEELYTIYEHLGFVLKEGEKSDHLTNAMEIDFLPFSGKPKKMEN